ncbi:MAG: beta-galactosidase trimerization domain-containing protein [Clostridiales bacterium]|nr:beta-galactosidase trimerization domain-containing protein [Clostridiales bacterium]
MRNSGITQTAGAAPPPRQVHLDFHTSEHILGVAERFDAELFANSMKNAHVTSATVFARCHHGQIYYMSEKFPELIHPALHRNLLFEQIAALRAKGLRAPIYIPVQWDCHSAKSHPEWLIRREDGSHEGGPFTEPGFYQSLCVNTGYFEFLSEMTREVCGLLGANLDGVFFDIVKTRPCYCKACTEKMIERGIDPSSELAVRSFAEESISSFKEKMTALVREYSTDCTIFYNAGHVGPCINANSQHCTHLEIESLPSGAWGYLHFPVAARYARSISKSNIGMTGKFHTEWGDFHSLKNKAALEFECFRMLSFGMGCSIGDQLEPCGTLNPATYDLIGHVFKLLAEREEWALPSEPVTEAVIVTSEDSACESEIPLSILGATQMFEELGLQFGIISQDMDFSGYPLVILPDDLEVDEMFQQRIDKYVESGGRVLSFAKGGLSREGTYPSCLNALNLGTRELHPDFVIAEGSLAESLYQGNEYVMYSAGEILEAKGGGEVALWGRAPYFKKEGDHFCSHMYVPSSKEGAYPAAIETKSSMLFAHPILSQYRINVPLWCKTLVANALNKLLGKKIVSHNGPSTLRVSVLHQPGKRRYTAHFLSYVPIKKSETIDVIEERTVLYDVTAILKLPEAIKQARLVPENELLDYDNGVFTLRKVDGYAIVELSY